MVEVVLYTREFCGFCTAAKRLLERKGISFREIDAGRSPELRREMIARSNGRTTYPQIFIDDRHVGGATELFALESDGRLDRLLAQQAA